MRPCGKYSKGEREKEKEQAIQFLTSILMRILGKMTMCICKSQKNNMIHSLA